MLHVYIFSVLIFFFFKQKTAYEMRISDWSSDVCSSDLPQGGGPADAPRGAGDESGLSGQKAIAFLWHDSAKLPLDGGRENDRPGQHRQLLTLCDENEIVCRLIPRLQRSVDTPEIGRAHV